MPAICVEEYVKLPAPDTVWVWSKILPTSGAMAIFSAPKVGKSKLILGLCASIADDTCDSFLGQSIDQHGPVLYVQLDTPRNLWIHGYLRYVTSPLARKQIYIVDREMEDKPSPFDIRQRECQLWIRDQVDLINPVMTVIDTTIRTHRGNENDPSEMALVYDAIVNCTQPSALVIISHKRKQQHGETGPGSLRGSSSVAGAVDCLISMTKSKLFIEARSDVDEEISISQQDDGTFSLNVRGQEIDDFMKDLIARGLPPKDFNRELMAKFNITERTSRRWRKDYESEQGTL